MLGSPCSPCCGDACRSTYDALRAKACQVTIGGDIPAHPGASIQSYTNSYTDASGNSIDGFQSQAVRASRWTPERTVTFGAFPFPLTSPTTLSETSNWYVVAVKYQRSNTVNNLPEETLRQEVVFNKTLVTSFKATQSPVGSHLLALDLGQSWFASGVGYVVFKKATDDYQVTCTMQISPSAGQCAVSLEVFVQSYYWQRQFIKPVSPTFTTNSASLTTDFLDSNSFPYQGGAITEDNFSRQYVPGTYSRQCSHLSAQLYVQSTDLIPYFSEANAQALFDYYKNQASSYVAVWNSDLSLEAVGSWALSNSARMSVGTFVAHGSYAPEELLSGSVSNFSFINTVGGLPTFMPSLQKPSPYSRTTITVPTTSAFVVEDRFSSPRHPAVFLDPSMSGQSDVTFYKYKAFSGLQSAVVEMQ